MPDHDPTSTHSVLITGANGFVGARLCRHLKAKGYKVIAGVRQTADLSLLENIEVEYRYGDITDPDTLIEMVKRVDYVCHNAGLTKAKSNQRFFDVNEQGTRNVFNAIIENNPGVKKIMLISSLAVIGGSRNHEKITEKTEPKPLTFYGKSKLAGEKIALEYKDRLNLVIIRPHGVYGPGDKEVFTFFDLLNKRIRPLVGDPKRKLQMVHVDDLCEGICRALAANTASGSIYTICENRSYSMREMIGLLEKASGKRAYSLRLPGWMFKVTGAVSGSVARLIGIAPMLTWDKAGELLASWEVSVEKAKRDLGFEATIPFERGAKETFDWYRKKGWLK